MEAMRKEGITKAAKLTKPRKEKAGAAASRKLACLCLKEHDGHYVKDGAAAASLIGDFQMFIQSTEQSNVWRMRNGRNVTMRLGRMENDFRTRTNKRRNE